METWQLLVGVTAMLVLYVAVSLATGRDLTPLDLLVGVVFGGIGLYLGQWLSNRIGASGE